MANEELPEYIQKMDATADKLLALVNDEKTSDTQRGRLFAQLLSYYKLRKTLIPSEEGNGLQEMTNVLKSQGGERSGSGGTKPRHGNASKDGKAIRSIIRSLPTYSRRAGGDQAHPELPDGSAPRNDGSDGADRGGDGSADNNGVANSHQL